LVPLRGPSRLADVFALLADSERNVSPNQTPAPSYFAPVTIIDGIGFTFEVTTFAYSTTVTHHYDGIVFSTGSQVFQNLKDIKLYPDTGIDEIIEGPAPAEEGEGGFTPVPF
jgi:hypothetical protein